MATTPQRTTKSAATQRARRAPSKQTASAQAKGAAIRPSPSPDAKPAESPAAAAGSATTKRPLGPVVADADAKPRKVKLVRDSFTMPKTEYEGLDQLKHKYVALGRPAKKSELIRAGIKALLAMPDAALLAAIAAVPTLKTGRPAKP